MTADGHESSSEVEETLVDFMELVDARFEILAEQQNTMLFWLRIIGVFYLLALIGLVITVIVYISNS